MSENKLSNELICKLINTVKSDSNNVSFGKFCPITADGVWTKALIDSGNLAGTCISYNFARKLGLDKSDFTMEPVKIGTAKKGSNLRVYGNTKRPIRLQFGGLAKEYKVKPFVIRGFSSDVNISLDFLEKHRIDQIHSQHCLKIQGKLVRLHDSRGPLAAKTANNDVIGALNDEKIARKEATEAYLDKDMIIPPNSAKYIKLRVPKVQRGFMEPGDGLLSSCELFTERNDLHPCREAAVHVKKNGIVFIPVLNTLMRPVELRKNQKFGTFTKYTFRQLKRQRSKLDWPEQRIIQEFKLDSAPALRAPKDLKKAIRFLKKFGGLFSENDEDFGETELIQHDIFTDGSAPSRQKVKPTNPLLQEKLSKQIDVWLEADIIEEANSPWNSRLLPVPKKDNRLRWVVDYRMVNSKTVKDSFPLPNVEECLSRMANCKIFSAMDGTGAYHVVKINPEHREKTAFSCHRGQFQFKRLPFGLCNAPSTYARLVNKVLEGLDRKYVANYLDDTCIFSRNLEEHLDQMEKVFNAHRDAGLKLAPRKCQFFQEEIEFLGHVVSNKGIKTNPRNIEVIDKWHIDTLEDVHTFVGKCIYYSNYVKDFATKIHPLQALLTKENLKNKKKKMLLTRDEQAAVEQMKHELTHAPILAYPDFQSPEPFILDTDWSNDPGAIGGVLSQIQGGKERVIAYGARKLRASEKAYSSNKGELLAVIHFMEKWKFYLWPRPFKLRTDHQALRWIYSMEVPSTMTTRWMQILANHNFEVEFRKGSNHGNADALSRARNISSLSVIRDMKLMEDTIRVNQLEPALEQEIVNSKTFDRAVEEDHLLQEVLKWFDSERPARSNYRSKDPDIYYYYELFPLMSRRGNRIFVQWKTPAGNSTTRLCVPQRLQMMIVQQVHSIGHIGMNNTVEAVKARYAFPSISSKVDAVISRCRDCQSRQVKLRDQRNTLISSLEGAPWQKVSIDIVEMKQSKYGNKYILTAKCCFTKWLEAIPMADMTAKTVGNLLYKEIIARHGMMQQIHSDRGRQFVDKVFNEMCEQFGIMKTATPAYNPKSNPVERSHRHLKACFKALKSTNEDWEDLLPSALLAIRTCVNRSTKMTPFMAMYGREANLPIDIVFGDPPNYQLAEDVRTWAAEIRDRLQKIYKFMRENQEVAVERSRATYVQAKLKKFRPGDLVWLFTPKIDRKLGPKMSNLWSGPWLIQEKISAVLYQITTHGSWNKKKITTVVSIDRLQKFKNKLEHESPIKLSANDVDEDKPDDVGITVEPGSVHDYQKESEVTLPTRIEPKAPTQTTLVGYPGSSKGYMTRSKTKLTNKEYNHVELDFSKKRRRPINDTNENITDNTKNETTPNLTTNTTRPGNPDHKITPKTTTNTTRPGNPDQEIIPNITISKHGRNDTTDSDIYDEITAEPREEATGSQPDEILVETAEQYDAIYEAPDEMSTRPFELDNNNENEQQNSDHEQELDAAMPFTPTQRRKQKMTTIKAHSVKHKINSDKRKLKQRKWAERVEARLRKYQSNKKRKQEEQQALHESIQAEEDRRYERQRLRQLEQERREEQEADIRAQEYHQDLQKHLDDIASREPPLQRFIRGWKESRKASEKRQRPETSSDSNSADRQPQKKADTKYSPSSSDQAEHDSLSDTSIRPDSVSSKDSRPSRTSMADSDFQNEPMTPENPMNESMISTSSSVKRPRSPNTSDSTPTNTSGLSRSKQRDTRPSPQDSTTDVEMATSYRKQEEYRSTTSTSATEAPSGDEPLRQESEINTGESGQTNHNNPTNSVQQPIFRPPKFQK